MMVLVFRLQCGFSIQVWHKDTNYHHWKNCNFSKLPLISWMALGMSVAFQTTNNGIKTIKTIKWPIFMGQQPPYAMRHKHVLTHWSRDKMGTILQMTFSNELSWMKMYEFLLKCHCSKFLPKGPFNNIPGLVQITAWHWWGDKPLSEPMTVRLPIHICITQPQWVDI